MTPGALIATTAIIFGAAVLRGLTGFGFALASVPLLGLVMEPAQAVPLSLIVVAIGGSLGLPPALRACEWPSLRGLALGAAVGSPLGALALSRISADSARLIIAAFTIAAVVGLARGGEPRATRSGPRDLVYGLLAGLFNGLAAMPGPPVVAYFMATPLNREAIRASLLVFFQFTAWIGVASAIAIGLLTADLLLPAAIGLPAFWIGNRVGLAIFARGSDAGYRRIALACLVAMALTSAVPAVRALVKAAAVAAN